MPAGMSARLLSGLCGTRQGAALWGNLRTKVLKKYNCRQSLADPSLYTRNDHNGRLLVTCIVDDFVITGDTAAILDFKSQISKEWEMTDEGRLFWCLNLRVTRDLERGLLKVDQAQYAQEIIERFSMECANPRATPMREKPRLSAVTCPDKTADYNETFPYASALGAILYMRLTRPDCLVAISILARFMKNPHKCHWTAIKDILRYLKGTRNRGLLYQASGLTIDDEWTLTLWVDSDYATCPDTRRSRAGFLIYLNKNLLAFNSVQQRGAKRPQVPDGLRDVYPGLKMPKTPMDGEPVPSMASGTCEAEYMALSLAVTELV